MDSTFNTAAGKNEQILTLRRDLIVDYYDKIKNTDIYIDRGWAAKGDPFDTAAEGFSFNQLLKSRTPISDSTNCAWVIGYMSTSPIYYDDALTEKTAASTVYSDSILNRAEGFNKMSDFPGYNVSTNKPNNTFGIPVYGDRITINSINTLAGIRESGHIYDYQFGDSSRFCSYHRFGYCGLVLLRRRMEARPMRYSYNGYTYCYHRLFWFLVVQ